MDIQLELLKEFVAYQQRHFPNSMLLSVIETTRGCPYGCTYCDWGGGTSTTVLQKTLSTVKKDIDALMNFDTTYLYIADANFGIFGERDVEIMQYITDSKIRTGRQFGLGFGGYAKTANKIEYIRDIMELDIKYNMSMAKEIKLSMQTLDDQVLKNIDRKNIPMAMQLEVLQPLAKNKKLPLYVEMIMGLPGITLDKYYYELDELGKHRLSVQWFEWILLPETPAYSREYRQQYGIGTITKTGGWGEAETGSEREVVVSCNSFTSTDYLQMLISNSIYHMFVLGGFYRDSVDWIKQQYNIGYGQITKTVYEEFFRKHKLYNQVKIRWNDILSVEQEPCTFDVQGVDVYGAYYFVALCFSDKKFADELIQWMIINYQIPTKTVNQERDLQITKDNFGKTAWHGVIMFDYRKDIVLKDLGVQDMVNAHRAYVDAGNTKRGKKKLFGILPL
jgi:radical SAM superfamily enzyme YgiQ (UPF0313 family)